MRLFYIILFFLIQAFQCLSQDLFIDRKGKLSFYSDAPLEDIEAHSKDAVSLLNLKDGSIAITLNVKSFQFEKALMQEHFNENFMESEKHPKSSFKGKFLNPEKIDLNKTGDQIIDVEGDLTIHGVTKKITTKAVINVLNSEIVAKTTFPVILKDYNISIPLIQQSMIAETVDIKAEFKYLPYKK